MNNAIVNTSKSNNLTLYQKYLELIYYTNDLIKKYPKSETFALVKEIKNSLYTGFRFLMYAVKTYNTQDKLNYLLKLDIELNLLKVYIRLSYRYKYISIKNYTSWSEILTNICNMLGGWISSCQKK